MEKILKKEEERIILMKTYEGNVYYEKIENNHNYEINLRINGSKKHT